MDRSLHVYYILYTQYSLEIITTTQKLYTTYERPAFKIREEVSV